MGATGHVGGITDTALMVDADGVQLTNWQLRRALEEGSHIPAPGSVGIDSVPGRQPRQRRLRAADGLTGSPYLPC